MKKHIITIAGLPGSGKSSTANGVAKILGYERFSSGDYWRQIAQEKGVSVEELNVMAETDPSIDHLIDDAVRRSGEKENLVIDSRLAFHWIPDSFKVFLKIDPKTAAERAFAHMQESGRVSQSATSVQEAYEKALARIKSENLRYKELYGVSYLDESQYDLVVDTTKDDLEGVTRTVAETYKKWLKMS
ncbi:MAG: cytidylate kinase family protein [Patescibacteria group bacterium]